MNISIEHLGQCKKLARIEADVDEVTSVFSEITREYQKEAKVPGFRKGTVPLNMVAKVYGQDIKQDSTKKLLQKTVQQIKTEDNLPVSTIHNIELEKLEPENPASFTMTFEVYPEFELPEYKGIPVTIERREVTDEDMENAFDILRQQQASFSNVERPIKEGDFVVVNYKGFCEGKPISDWAPAARGLTSQNGFWMKIVKGSFIPGFTEQLIDLSAGDKKTVKVQFPEDFVTPQVAGKNGEFEVEICEVKEQVLPEVDDEFAKSYGAQNVEELKKGIRQDLENELAKSRNDNIMNQILEKIVEGPDFEIPESDVTKETKNAVYELVKHNQQLGTPREVIEEQKEAYYNRAFEAAKKRVKLQYILTEVADKENIKVENEELANVIAMFADKEQVSFKNMLNKLKNEDRLVNIHNSIMNSKITDFLIKNAEITETNPSQETGEVNDGQTNAEDK
ncbi:MAG: trigger factor [Verrucomicrobia bacterium]|nr:trigger factor [Verrucomicrobiota bacterium]MCF7708951.1 trigger factor [Verrucomicrobiota bacterium]